MAIQGTISTLCLGDLPHQSILFTSLMGPFGICITDVLDLCKNHTGPSPTTSNNQLHPNEAELDPLVLQFKWVCHSLHLRRKLLHHPLPCPVTTSSTRSCYRGSPLSFRYLLRRSRTRSMVYWINIQPSGWVTLERPINQVVLELARPMWYTPPSCAPSLKRVEK